MTDAYNSLLRDITDNKVVYFIGNGINRPIIPSWEDLVGKMCSKCDVRFDKENLKESAERCLGSNQTIEISNNYLKDVFAEDKYSDIRPAIDSMPRLKGNYYLTTNFDSYLQQAFAHNDSASICLVPKEKCNWIDVVNMGKDDKKHLFYVHGKFEEKTGIESLVLCVAQYEEAYRIGNIGSFLTQLFFCRSYNIFLICFDPFKDNNIASIIENRNKIIENNRYEIGDVYILLPDPNGYELGKYIKELNDDKKEKARNVIAEFNSDIEKAKANHFIPILYDPKNFDRDGIDSFFAKLCREVENREPKLTELGERG